MNAAFAVLNDDESVGTTLIPPAVNPFAVIPPGAVRELLENTNSFGVVPSVPV